MLYATIESLFNGVLKYHCNSCSIVRWSSSGRRNSLCEAAVTCASLHLCVSIDKLGYYTGLAAICKLKSAYKQPLQWTKMATP